MRPEELTELVRRQPFIPLRIHLTDGRTFDVTHPDQIRVLRARVDISIGVDPNTNVIDRIEFVSLLHVVRVEDIHAPVAPGSNGPAGG